MASKILTPGMYWLTKFATVSGMRSGDGNRIQVRLLGAVHGDLGRSYRVMLPHGVVGIAQRADLIRDQGS